MSDTTPEDSYTDSLLDTEDSVEAVLCEDAPLQPKEPLSEEKLKRILEGVLLAAAAPMDERQLQQLFDEQQRPAKDEIQAAMDDITVDCKGRGFEVQRVASGWRYQVCQDLSPWVSRLWEEKPQKYTRATLETLSLIAYRQPITRGDIESIRGVAVSSNIIRSLLERSWVRVVGHRDVPGRPALYATTKEFLDYFNLKSLEELPTLSEIRDLDSINKELQLSEQLELPTTEQADTEAPEIEAPEEMEPIDGEGVSSEDLHDITDEPEAITDELPDEVDSEDGETVLSEIADDITS